MKDLVDQLPLVMKELQQIGCMEIKLKALGTRLVTIVEKVDLDQAIILADRYRVERPAIAPPDIITFQQQKKQSAKEK